MDSIGTHDEAIKLIDRAEKVALLFAFTFDREDVTDALLRAKAKGDEVKIGADRSNSLNGRTRNQLQKLQELDAGGVEVNVVQGGTYSAEYRATRRAHISRGFSHAKTLYTDAGVIVGSGRWTSASRANFEAGLLVSLDETSSTELKEKLLVQWNSGTALRDAARLEAQRGD